MSRIPDFSRAIYHLLIWGEWRKANTGQVTRGYPSRSAGVATGGASDDFDSMVEREDAKTAAICDAIIYDLGEANRLILENEYILGRSFKPNRGNYSAMLDEAHSNFWSRAKKHLI